MTAEASSPAAVRDLYERLTDLMTQAMGGYLHGGYADGPAAPGPAEMEDAAGALTDLVAAQCGLTPGLRVLDVGSGSGKATLWVAAAYQVHVSGITLSGYQVRLSRELAAARGLAGRADFRVADVHDLPFADGTFDAALAIESFCHVTDRAAAYREIGRVLRGGARVAVTDLVLRRPIRDPGARAVVDASNACFQNGPILTRREHAAAVRSAGLELAGFSDIGDRVLPSFVTVARSMREGRALVGGSMSDRDFYAMTDALEGFATVAEIGYALIVARKPA